MRHACQHPAPVHPARPVAARRRTARAALALATSLAATLVTAGAGAADVHWSPQCGTGDWDSFCWSLADGGVPMLWRPASGDAAWLQRDGGRLQLSFGAAGVPPVPALLSRLTLDGRQGGAVELTVLQGQLQAGAAVLGATGRGAIIQQGGRVGIDGDLVLGQASGSQGVYQLEGGTLGVAGSVKQSQGRGTLVLAGGTLLATRLALDTLALRASGDTPRTEAASWDADTRRTEVGLQGRVTLVREAGLHQVREDLLIGDGSTLDLRGGRTVVDGALQGQGSGSTLLLGGGALQVRGDIAVGVFRIAGPAGQTTRFTLAEGQQLQTGHSWLAQGGTTEFVQEGGSHTVAGDLLLSTNNVGQSTYWLRGGRLDVGQRVDTRGSGSTLVLDGGQLAFGESLSAHRLLIGEDAGRRGELVLGSHHDIMLQQLVVGGRGEGRLQSSTALVHVGADVVLGREAGSLGRLQVDAGLFGALAGVTVGQQGTGELGLAGGTLATGSLLIAADPDATGRITLTGGTLLVRGAVSGGLGSSRIDFDGGRIAADTIAANHVTLASAAGRTGSHTVAADQSLWTRRLDLGLAGDGTLTLDGGNTDVWEAARLGVLAGSQGRWVQRGGNATVHGDLVLGAEGGRGWLQLDGGTLSVQGALRGGSGFSAIDMQGGLLQIGTPGVVVDQLGIGPAARWQHAATVRQTLRNEGQLQAPRLQVDGVLVNLGQVVLAGGEVTGAGRWVQQGSFTGHGRLALAGGIENSGTMAFEAGASSVAARLAVAASGRIEVAGGAQLSVEGLASFDPRAVLAVADGGEASFAAGLHWSTGAVRSGGGLWRLGGEVDFFGTPAALNAAGSLALADGARTTLRLGAGGHDALQAGGTLTLGGTLVLLPWEGLQPQAGSRYDLLDWGVLAGRFEAIDLSALPAPGGLRWDTSALYSRGEISLVTLSPVPEPGGWALLLAGLGVLGFVGRQRGAWGSTAVGKAD